MYGASSGCHPENHVTTFVEASSRGSLFVTPIVWTLVKVTGKVPVMSVLLCCQNTYWFDSVTRVSLESATHKGEAIGRISGAVRVYPRCCGAERAGRGRARRREVIRT